MKQYPDETQLIPKPASWYDVALVTYLRSQIMALGA